jgi:ubiquinone/menaquinone biosynthesis C-methylase UbiE
MVEKFPKLPVDPRRHIEENPEDAWAWEEVMDASRAEEVFGHLQQLLEKAGIPLAKDVHVLEVGTGKGLFLKHMVEQGVDAIGVDARPRHEGSLPVAASHIELLPFRDGSFDVVFSSAAFDEEVYEQYRPLMLSEIGRVLKTGGVYAAYLDHSNRKRIGDMGRIAKSNDISLYRKKVPRTQL